MQQAAEHIFCPVVVLASRASQRFSIEQNAAADRPQGTASVESIRQSQPVSYLIHTATTLKP
jgi:hypothetical protein